ncbi:DUF433 domain-containing protein [Planctomycetales bacterium ZRK34]|nr:DUF433 domain-containing protein [Planctomycetales bacterium ZRK34]
MEFDRITSDPKILDGQPIIRGTRLTVRRVLTILAEYGDRDELRKDYPQLEDEDIRQALAYAAATLEDRIIELRPAS